MLIVCFRKTDWIPTNQFVQCIMCPNQMSGFECENEPASAAGGGGHGMIWEWLKFIHRTLAFRPVRILFPSSLLFFPLVPGVFVLAQHTEQWKSIRTGSAGISSGRKRTSDRGLFKMHIINWFKTAQIWLLLQCPCRVELISAHRWLNNSFQFRMCRMTYVLIIVSHPDNNMCPHTLNQNVGNFPNFPFSFGHINYIRH